MSHNSLSHEQKLSLGISENLVRLSIGLEHVDDLIADLNAGFERLRQTCVE
ncbi:Methionine gamma-lyase [compost metagenome]